MSKEPLSLLAMKLGTLLMTREAARRLVAQDAMDCLDRHMIGDYGDVDESDRQANDLGWEYGFPVVSSYADRQENCFLIITEADRRVTTILLPDEY